MVHNNLCIPEPIDQNNFARMTDNAGQALGGVMSASGIQMNTVPRQASDSKDKMIFAQDPEGQELYKEEQDDNMDAMEELNEADYDDEEQSEEKYEKYQICANLN